MTKQREVIGAEELAITNESLASNSAFRAKGRHTGRPEKIAFF